NDSQIERVLARRDAAGDDARVVPGQRRGEMVNVDDLGALVELRIHVASDIERERDEAGLGAGLPARLAQVGAPDVVIDREGVRGGDDGSADECDRGSGCDGGDEAAPGELAGTGEASTHRLGSFRTERIAYSQGQGAPAKSIVTLTTC